VCDVNIISQLTCYRSHDLVAVTVHIDSRLLCVLIQGSVQKSGMATCVSARKVGQEKIVISQVMKPCWCSDVIWLQEEQQAVKIRV